MNLQVTLTPDQLGALRAMGLIVLPEPVERKIVVRSSYREQPYLVTRDHANSMISERGIYVLNNRTWEFRHGPHDYLFAFFAG